MNQLALYLKSKDKLIQKQSGTKRKIRNPGLTKCLPTWLPGSREENGMFLE